MKQPCEFVNECDSYTPRCEATDSEECELFYPREGESDEFDYKELRKRDSKAETESRGV